MADDSDPSEIDQLRDEEHKAKQKWMACKKKLKRQKSRVGGPEGEYQKWPSDKKADFVLVYKPLRITMDPTWGIVDPDPRPHDLDDKQQTMRGEAGDEAAILRVRYIQALRDNDLDVEIENFVSGMKEYRAIKIYGKKTTMDHWAEKFLMMKPVRPPKNTLDRSWEVEQGVEHGVAPDNERYYRENEEEESTDESEMSEEEEEEDGGTIGGGEHGSTSQRRKRWGRLRSIVRGGPKELRVKNMLAMYNEVYYTYDEKAVQEEQQRHLPTLGRAARALRLMMNNVIRRGDGTETDDEGGEGTTLARKREKQKKTYLAAMEQMMYLNRSYKDNIFTKIDTWIYQFFNGKRKSFQMARDDFFARAIRAPFTIEKRTKFWGHGKEFFFYDSERSLMVFKILENPLYHLKGGQLRKYGDEKEQRRLGLQCMYNKNCFVAAYPLHAGPYKIGHPGKPSKPWNEVIDHFEKDNPDDSEDLTIRNPRQLLRYFWSSSHMRWKSQPMNIIRNYFGSVTAIYFAFTGYYNTWLTLPAAAGLCIFAYGLTQMIFHPAVEQICDSGDQYPMCTECWMNGNCEVTHLSNYCFTTRITSAANNGAVIIFSMFMMAWLSLFVTFFKRYQNTIAHMWGTTNSRSASAELRVKYMVTKKTKMFFNPFAGTREAELTFFDRLPFYIAAFTTVSVFLSIAVLLTLTITIYNYSLSVSLYKAAQSDFTKKYAEEIANVITGLISGTSILTMSFIYHWVANKLTELENHRTQRDHDNHLSFKVYLFEFINHYGTLFYIAFFKGNLSAPDSPRYLFGEYFRIENCAPGGCMSEVSMQMIIIMSLKQSMPLLKGLVKALNLYKYFQVFKRTFCCSETKRRIADENLSNMQKRRRQLVEDFELREPNEMYREYVNNIIQLGFLTMFVTALPIAPLICVLLNRHQLRQEATQFVKRYRRPVGFRADGIGTWMNILEVLTRMSILVNAVLIAFTFDYLPMLVYKEYHNEGSNDGYIDFMLAKHEFVHPSTNTTMTCRYWSYINPANENTDFWMQLMLARMIFIFSFQNISWAMARIIELMVGNTPAYVRQRMVLEETLAQEWLSDDEDEINENNGTARASRLISQGRRTSAADKAAAAATTTANLSGSSMDPLLRRLSPVIDTDR